MYGPAERFPRKPWFLHVPPALVFSRLSYVLVLVFCNQYVSNTKSACSLVSFQIAAIEDVFAHLQYITGELHVNDNIQQLWQ